MLIELRSYTTQILEGTEQRLNQLIDGTLLCQEGALTSFLLLTRNEQYTAVTLQPLLEVAVSASSFQTHRTVYRVVSSAG